MCTLIGAALASAAWYWTQRPLPLPAERVDFVVEAGSSPRHVARAMQKAGIPINETGFVALARLNGQDTRIQAGAYEATQGDSPNTLLARMVDGDMVKTRITLIEGWTYQRIRDALAAHPHIRQTLDSMDEAGLLTRLGAEYSHVEGLFYPDTYVFVPGTTDFDILRRAYRAQMQLLSEMWPERDPESPLSSPYEALIMASLIEKETGLEDDRARIAGVFENRLRLKMPLQTDPTVIYGMGERYQGRIRKVDLQLDTPWNTYTRGGLPPTPIASPGRAALRAALHPEKHRYLYFVSRGDGTSEFSQNLAAHNRAVAKYILGRNP